MTFRSRLLQAILLVVVATTAATLYVAQRQNSASYRALVDELFRFQSAAFQREHETRHTLAAEQLARLAASVRLFAALEENDPEVYKIASDELRSGDFSFFRLLDADGLVIEPPADGRAGQVDLRNLQTPLAPRNVPEAAAGEVQLGFVEVGAGAGGASTPYRVLAAAISNFGEQVGTLILGQRIAPTFAEPLAAPASPLPTPAEAGAARDVATIRSTIAIDGRLTSGDVPAEVRPALAGLVAREAGSPSDQQFTVDGTTYRFQRALLNAGSAYPPAYLVSIVSMAPFEAQQRTLALRITATGVAAFLVASAFALMLSRQLARPVAELVDATRAIRQGNYQTRVRPSSTTEMNTLADSFNAMAADLALKERYHSVLQQVADPQVAEGLISGQVKLGGELREVTVMFCDIRGYTALTVGRAPEAVILMLNDHLGAMTRVVQAHRGVINQFAGDAIMALFGAPRSYGNDAERAVRCAVAMMKERERLNRDAEIPIRIGIGIASGAMVAGCIGAESRSDYTVVGERVNLAARLSSAAGAGEILVDDATRVRMGAAFATDAMPRLSLKGFGDQMPAHRILPAGAPA